MPRSVVAGLDEILINGNYGDFVMNPDSLEILRWFRDQNPGLSIKISTNGGIRTADFWRELATLDAEVCFCIDGLGDTHGVYRQDTDYDRVLDNARIFIRSGGRAVWLMTEFDHNLHQFDEAEATAKKENFYSFVRRPTLRNKGPVFDRTGQKVFVMQDDLDLPERIDQSFVEHYLQQTKGVHVEPTGQHSKSVLLSRISSPNAREISCESKNTKSIYINSEGHIMPCCWVGIDRVYGQVSPQWPQIVKENSLSESMDLFKNIEDLFTVAPLNICAGTCAK